MKTNIAGWRILHQKGNYYDVHPNYSDKEGRKDTDLEVIEEFFTLRAGMRVAVIGSGYGRETAMIAPRVGVVFAIDVEECFPRMRAFLHARNVENVVPLDAGSWKSRIVPPVDFVYSIVTFQHITRDLAKDYVEGFAPLLSPRGKMLIQFSESPTGTFDTGDVAIEPNIKWTKEEIADLVTTAGLQIDSLRTISGIGGTRARRPWIWHWAFIGRPGEEGE